MFLFCAILSFCLETRQNSGANLMNFLQKTDFFTVNLTSLQLNLHLLSPVREVMPIYLQLHPWLTE